MLLENYAARDVLCWPEEGLHGRRKIRTNAREITAENAVEELEKSLAKHSINAGEIQYLYDFYRGKQDIRNKVKYERENINNKVTVNRASEIVTFKTAYLLNAPVQYSAADGGEAVGKEVSRLNTYMRSEDKDSKDKEIVDWVHICGVGPRLVLDDKEMDEEDGAPFCIYTMDPRFAYVIYSGRIGEKPLAGVVLQQDENDRWYADMHTDKRHFIIRDEEIVKDYPHQYGGVPLVEYVNNTARMGAFEPVISILNNINTLESNAVDAVQDFVNGFDVFQNCDIDDDTYKELASGGKAVKVKTVVQGMEAKVYRIVSELSQPGVQTRIDDFTEAYLTICGMPNRNGGSSTSDTGTATIFRDGWQEAESRAIDSETLFKRSEREMLRIVLRVCAINGGGKYALNLNLSDIKTEFLRKNLANLQSKVQVLCELLNNDQVHPMDAYDVASLFPDNLAAFQRGQSWKERMDEAQEESLREEMTNARIEALRAGRQGYRDSEQADPSEGGGE